MIANIRPLTGLDGQTCVATPVARSASPVESLHPSLDLLRRREEFNLVQRVFLTPGRDARVVLFSGVGHGSGCSRICARSSELLAAEEGGSVHLWLLPAGSPALQPSLKTDRMRSRLADLRAEFRYVLIDAPPADLYPEPMLLAPMTDGVVLVLEAGATRRETARQTKSRLEAAGVRLLGVVLNKRTFPVPEALYRRC